MEKQELIGKLEAAYQIVCEISVLEKKIDNLNESITQAKREMLIQPKPKRTWALVLGIIFAVMAVQSIPMLVTAFSKTINLMFLAYLFNTLLFGALSGIFFIIRKRGYKDASYQRKQKNLSEHIACSEKLIEETERSISEIIESNRYEEAGFMPEKYRTEYAVGYILDCVKNMRADTLKEAINLYEQHLERHL